MTNIIYSTPNDPVNITSLSPKAGFTLSDGLVVPSPILLIDGQCFLWDVAHPTQEGKDPLGFKWDGWSQDKVRVFEALNPRPEILLVGTGTATQFAPPAFKKYLNSLGIQLDVLDSRNAASTYNLLQEEGRRVAAALYPVSHLSARTGLVG
ncbi:NADH dehydrogenase 1 alpha subcomplex assembly factor 3 [Rhodotorula diobovata]|uniref:NADH dehydrogenase 1 alpha subcomplex assembly factor 3 n=1 Tax=Rhodotorula diobovata TaxID=5288 RepID=A0A5C5FMX6_9BASI|nr:NADH dehydrogenase 1 alpha subcomplex assembly factor 3 [Rhodotorula diobovata]